MHFPETVPNIGGSFSPR